MSHFIELIFTFLISLSVLFILRKVSRKVGLIDQPNARKLHEGSIPLVGGLAITFTFLYFLFNNPDLLVGVRFYAISILVLVIVGALDDRFDISFKLRFLVQGALSVLMMVQADIQLHTVGNVFAFGNVELGILGYLITILAVVGAINAFNMVDGIDGLLGGLSIVTFGGLGFMLWFDGQTNLAYLCFVLIVIILPYIMLNLGWLGRKRKVFMGDAGSMVIGFTVIWFLLVASQNGTRPPLRPVTALWLIAVPLIDMVAIMIRRIRRGVSPFKPDREHLHHIFQRLGLNSHQTLFVICFISLLFAVFGILGEIFHILEYVMFYLFILCFVIYTLLLSNVWSITKKIRSWKRYQRFQHYSKK